jgi:OmpA-OmpF porin, OOP family
MKQNYLSSLFFFFLVTSIGMLSPNLVAQGRFPNEMGLLLGASNYAGDIVKKADFDWRAMSPSFGAYYRMYLNTNISFRFGLNQSTLKGDDNNFVGTDRILRGFTFKSPLTEFSARVEYDFLNHNRRRGGNTFTKFVSPFIHVGAGVALINPKNDFNQEKNNYLSSRITEDINNRITNLITVPFGGGLRYDLSEQLVIGVEASLNAVFTDYLDGISISGEPEYGDWYAIGGISISYRLNSIFARHLLR